MSASTGDSGGSDGSGDGYQWRGERTRGVRVRGRVQEDSEYEAHSVVWQQRPTKQGYILLPSARSCAFNESAYWLVEAQKKAPTLQRTVKNPRCKRTHAMQVGLGAGETQEAEYFGPDCSLLHCPSGDDPGGSMIVV